MLKQIRALIVEDNPADVLQEKLALRNILPVDFDVFCADRLADALKVLHDIQLDVVLLDLGLPDSEGLETLQRVRAAADSVAIVVLTGSADEATSLQALDQGAQDFLLKSEVTPELLHRTIRFAIHRIQHQRQTAGGDLEARLRAVLEAVGEAVITVDEAGDIRDWNSRAESLLGWLADEVVGRPLEDYLQLAAHGVGYRGESLSAMARDSRQRTLEVEAVVARTQTDKCSIRAITLRSAEAPAHASH